MDKVKELGQVMTPKNIVDYMIGLLNLTEEDKKTKIFLDNSCGNGAFVFGLISAGIPVNNIYACDIDEDISKEVKKVLPKDNFYLGSIFNKIDWVNKFDFIIGNPPYVRIHNIQDNVKNQISKFSFCKGMYDLYYAFYEFGLKLLNDSGKMLYISPNSFVKNKSGENMRDYIKNNNLLFYYEDFAHEQKFDNVSTYTAIVGLSKDKKNNISTPWIKERKKIGLSYSTLQNGIATLADKIFISDDFSFLESTYVKPILKASTGEYKYCICPPKSEEELKNNAPKTYEYLQNNREKLSSRSLSGSTKWFEFGRSQGMKYMWNEKIAISTVVGESGLKFYRLPADTMVYSGLYLTADNLDKVEEELSSNDLLDYIFEEGKPMRGNYYQIGSTLLKNY